MYQITKEKLDFLSQTGLFRSLTPHQLTEIAPTIKEIVVPPGQYIINENEVGDEVYVIWKLPFRFAEKMTWAIYTIFLPWNEER